MRDLKLDFLWKMRLLIQEENARQLEKWGVQDRLPAEWMLFLTEEVGELANAVAEWDYRYGTTQKVVDEAIQVATLALKIAEMFHMGEKREPRS